MGENGVYVALEEYPFQIRKNMEQFGWDVSSYEKNGNFVIVDAFTGGIGSSDVTDERELADILKRALREHQIKRVVIDSVTTLYISKPVIARSVIFQLKKLLSGLGCTSLFVSQVSVTEKGFGWLGLSMVWMVLYVLILTK